MPRWSDTSPKLRPPGAVFRGNCVTGNQPEMECPFARMHREYREQCIKNGTYRPLAEEELRRGISKWKAECERLPKPRGRRRKNPKGTAD